MLTCKIKRPELDRGILKCRALFFTRFFCLHVEVKGASAICGLNKVMQKVNQVYAKMGSRKALVIMGMFCKISCSILSKK